jgi:hypothetical protein
MTAPAYCTVHRLERWPDARASFAGAKPFICAAPGPDAAMPIVTAPRSELPVNNLACKPRKSTMVRQECGKNAGLLGRGKIAR